MWYQLSEEQSFIVLGALRAARGAIQRRLDEGRFLWSERDWLVRELVQLDSLVEKFYDDGSLSLPLGSGDRVFKW